MGTETQCDDNWDELVPAALCSVPPVTPVTHGQEQSLCTDCTRLNCCFQRLCILCVTILPLNGVHIAAVGRRL